MDRSKWKGWIIMGSKIECCDMNSDSISRHNFNKMMERLEFFNQKIPENNREFISEMFDGDEAFVCTNDTFQGMSPLEMTMFVMMQCMNLDARPGMTFFAFEYKNVAMSPDPFWILFVGCGVVGLESKFTNILERAEKEFKEDVYKLVIGDNVKLISIAK